MMPDAATQECTPRSASPMLAAAKIVLGTAGAGFLVLGCLYLFIAERHQGRIHSVALDFLRAMDGQAFTRDELFLTAYDGAVDSRADEHDRTEAFGLLIRQSFVSSVIRCLQDKQGVLHPVQLYFSDPGAIARLDASRQTSQWLIREFTRRVTTRPPANRAQYECR